MKPALIRVLQHNRPEADTDALFYLATTDHFVAARVFLNEARMIYYDYYANIPRETIDAFVRESELGRLVTASPDSVPHIGLYPFVYDGRVIEMHLNRADDIKARRVKFKLAQNRPVEVRESVVRQLRARGRPTDDRAADAVQWTIDRESSKS